MLILAYMPIFGTFSLVRGNNTKKNHNTSVCDRSMEIGTHDQDDLRKLFFKGDTWRRQQK